MESLNTIVRTELVRRWYATMVGDFTAVRGVKNGGTQDPQRSAWPSDGGVCSNYL
jgi:hypothetical protein